MIKKLSIRNYAIIDEVEIDFSDSLTIITGETGAGKSIMLGALGLIMGKRADKRALYQHENKCIVEASFNVEAYDLKAFFEELELDYDTEVILRREITPSGKSRAFINDSPVRLPIMQEVSTRLIDLHQQFDTLDIHESSFQMQVVDALAQNKELLRDYRQHYQKYQKHKLELQKLIERSQNAAKETDFLEFQLEELHTAALEAGEQKELEQEQKRLNNAEEIKRILGGAAQSLTESEFNLAEKLTELSTEILNIVEFHPKLKGLQERFDSAIIELEDLSGEFENIAEDTEYDGPRLQEVSERLDLIYRLQTKHNVQSVEELLDIQNDLEEQLQAFSDLSGDIERIEGLIDQQEGQLRELGQLLSERRQAVIPSFEQDVDDRLTELSMPHARLKVERKDSEDILPDGTDELRFLFAPNKGSTYEEIKGIASGGELSRLALSVKSLVASAIPLPTMMFDEIDSGVSGDVAMRMGDIMQRLSSHHQVVAITHSPQIAAKAHRHYFVHKMVEEERTITGVRILQLEERVEEIAKMLSGDPPTEFARENARELLTYG